MKSGPAVIFLVGRHIARMIRALFYKSLWRCFDLLSLSLVVGVL